MGTTEVTGTMEEVTAGTVEATIMAGLILTRGVTGTMEEMTGTLEVTMAGLTPILEVTGTMEATMAGTVETTTTTTTGQTPMETGTMAIMVTILEEDPQNLLLKRVRLMLKSSLELLLELWWPSSSSLLLLLWSRRSTDLFQPMILK